MKKVAFLDTVHPILQEGLEELGWFCDDLSTKSLDEINNEIHLYHGIVVRSRLPINKKFLVKATKLEFIARSGAGMENIDIGYCKANDIELFNAPEGNRNAVGEHALGMLLALFNNLTKSHLEVKKGIWDREGNRGVELDGKTVGIIGFGNNGSAFAKKMRGFEVEILAYDKYKKGFGNDNVIETNMTQIFREADIISFHIPQNEETLFLADDQFLSKFEKPIYLINLARGKIVKTEALVKGLKEGRILGACLDVLEYEKTSFENLFSRGQSLSEDFEFILESNLVLLSPHVGGWTKESYFKLSEVLYSKIKKHYNL